MKKNSFKTFRVHANLLKEFAGNYNSKNLFTYVHVDWNFSLKLISRLAKRKVQLSYGNKTLKKIKTILESARRQKLHSNTDYQGKGWTVTTKKAKGQIVTFTCDELNQLADLKLEGNLDKIRDICLIGAGTGQRFGDFIRYKPDTHAKIPLIYLHG